MNINGNGKGHSTPYLRIALFAVAIALLGLLLYRQIDRLGGPRRAVWVAASDLAAGAVVDPGSLEHRRLREAEIPAGAVTERAAIAGRRLARSKPAGASFDAADFAVAPADPGSISRLVPEGRVLMTLQVGARAVPFPELRRGDRLEVLAVGRDGGPGGSVASDAYLIGWIEPSQGGGPEKAKVFGVDLSPPRLARSDDRVSLLLALHPEHVVPVARALAAGARVSIVLHGGSEVREGNLLELPSQRPAAVELIAGKSRQTVTLSQ